MIDIKKYKSIYIVTKDNETIGTKVKKYIGKDLTGNEAKNLNLIYWINPDRGELFFAKKIILVEGQTDKTILAFLAKKYNFYKYDYTIVDCGSKDNIPLYIKLLNNFLIPYMVVFDKDHQKDKSEDAKNKADSLTKKIKGNINEEIGDIIILENDIEEEINLKSDQQKKPYKALEHVSNTNFSISESFKNKLKIIFDIN